MNKVSFYKIKAEICNGEEMSDKKVHFRQIPTTRSGIENEIYDVEFTITNSLLRCFLYDIGSDEYMNHLMMVAMRLDTLSRMVYKAKNGYKKLPERKYKEILFEWWAGTPQDVYERSRLYKKIKIDSEQVYKKLYQIADLICPMLASEERSYIINDYAYSIDFIIRHKGNLPAPTINGSLMPKYLGYDYKKSTMAKMIAEYTGIYVVG